MRNSLLFIVLLAAGVCCHGQVPKVRAGSEWSHVEALQAGTRIHMTARRQKLNCRVKGADEVGLSCFKGSTEVTVARTDVLQVEIIHRGRSGALAAGIGAGTGFAIDEALSASIFTGGHVKGNVAVASAAVGALILGPVGYFGGWIRETIYTAAP